MSQSSFDPVSGHEEQESLLTAYALGQLAGPEREAVEASLASPDAALARQRVEEISRLAEALASARSNDLPERSSELRRAVLAAAAQGDAVITLAAKPVKTARWGRRVAEVGVVVATLCVLVAMLLPAVQSSRVTARRSSEFEGEESTYNIRMPLGAAASPSISPDAQAMQSRSKKSADYKQGGGQGNVYDARFSAITGDRRDRESAPLESSDKEAGLRLGYAQSENYPSVDLGVSGEALHADTGARDSLAELGNRRRGQAGGQQGQAVGGSGAPQEVGGARHIVGMEAPPRAFVEAERFVPAMSASVPPEDSHGLTRSLRPQVPQMPGLGAASGERYNRFIENGFLAPTEHPLSTFSIDVDTASYANVRRFLMAGQRPPRDAVRLEEFVNYFRYDDPAPKSDVPFSVSVESAACPWRDGHRVVRVGLAGRDVARDQRPAGNLVFLVDVSGSMADDNKLPLVKQALTMLVDELTENDRVAIVTYAGNAGLKLPSTSGDQKQKIRDAIQSLSSGGSTHGSAGITLAYEQAAERFIQGGANRVILATDGDLNVGITSDEALVELITRMAKGGTFLTVLGFGQGNLQDEKMEKLADKGNGVYAYIDSVREARKVLVEQLTGSTITIAKDVKIQVEFNPSRVASYRLLGYENRALADRDFRDDTKDAGEIGAGHGVTALYEIALVGEEAPNTTGGAEPLKYQPQPKHEGAPVAKVVDGTSRELLTVKLRYKKPDGDTSRLLEVPLADTGTRFEDASTNLRFASAVAAFGMILRGSEYVGEATLPMVATMAADALGNDEGGYRAEFLDLVRRAQQMQ